MRQRLAVLGSTGSIGKSALEVVRHHSDRLEVAALAAYGRDPEILERQALEFRPARLAVFEPGAARELSARLPNEIKVLEGEEGLLEAVRSPEVDRVVAAMVGAAGLSPVHAALEAGKSVALANKEPLVAAGGLLTGLASRTGASILPIDSEHVALHQALRCGSPEEVERLMLTASGGPFRNRDLASWREIRPEDALKHPTWEMGAKITVDSATLMNKGLELIEAHYLFDLPAEKIDVVIHPQSLVHSLVEFQDGSWVAQLSVNDMVFPIQYALSYPERWSNRFTRLRPSELGRLEFEPLDSRRFPAVDLARRALEMGESGPAVLNAANEVAVRAFLDRQLPFPEIVSLAAEVLELHQASAVETLQDAIGWDAWGRSRAEEILGRG